VVEERSESLRFVAIVDHEDNILAQAGFEGVGAPSDLSAFENKISSDDYLYVHEMSGGGGPWWETDRVRVSRILLVLDATEADFLLRQAYVHILVAGIALLALWVLSLYLVRTVRRFLDLKVQEESERHLASLGRMSATLAHEIRNPLGAMKGLTQVVREELPPEHTTQAMLKTVVDEAKRLEGLVTDLLSFARTRQIELSEFDLIALTEEVVALIQQETDDVEAIVSVSSSEDNIPITSDRDGLEQVLLNVVRNAIEASSKGGQVVIDLRAKTEKEAVITVKDQGEGLGDIDPEELFQPFKTTKARGSGLGLAVSRQIITRLGGRIALLANADQGANCTVEIPRRRISFPRGEGQPSSKA
jgi:two-component system sensor histidine kinase HydH